MTLQEAILHCLEKAMEECSGCEHEQVANWLIELRDIREFIEPLKSFNTNNLYLEELKKIVRSKD